MKLYSSKQKKIYKLQTGLVLLALLLNTGSALAQCTVNSREGTFSVNINNLMSCAENRYGYDPNVWRRSQQKSGAPEVSIFFDKTDPKEGEKVTATAVPELFKSQPEELYYTWYILHTDEDGDVIDSDHDGMLTDEIENGKREAMGKVARGGFDPILFGIQRSQYTADGDEDKDAFLAPFGGINGVGAKKIGNSDANDSDHDWIENSDDNCPNNFNPDQDDTDNDGDGDICDADIDGDRDKNENDNCPFNDNSDQADADGDGLGDICDNNDDADNDADNDGVADNNDNCPDIVNQNQADVDEDGHGDACDTSDDREESSATSINRYEHFNQKGVVSTNTITRCYKHNFGVKADLEEVTAGNDTNSGRDMVIECEHVFPEASPKNQFIAYESGDLKCDNDYDIGDGHFSNREEACWRLDPTNPDTDGDGIEDEKDLAGLNQQHFTWNYQKGDRVGVMIEGTSMTPTNENQLNAYYKIMWAAPSVCVEPEEDILKNDRCDNNDDHDFNYYATVEVSEKGSQNLETSLDSVPANPQFDFYQPDNSDLVTVNATITNEEADDRYVYYDWSIYRCGSMNFDECITTETYDEDALANHPDKNLYLTKNCEPGQEQEADDCGIEIGSPTSGIGLSEISFRPKKEVMQFSKEYFKVVLKSKRQASDNRYAVSDIIIPITQNDIELDLYSVEMKSDGSYGLGEKICDQGLYGTLCPVYPNQVVGVKANPRFEEGSKYNIESYAWQLNGSALMPPVKCVFDDCDMEDTVYFPVIGSDMSVGDISVTAKRENGEDLIAQRMFSVNPPIAKIYSDDITTAWPFVKFDDSVSDTVMEGYSGSLVDLRADVIPDYLVEDPELIMKWFINGTEVATDDIAGSGITLEHNTISLPLNQSAGSSINISVQVEKPVTSEQAELLSSAWNVLDPTTQYSEESIELKVIAQTESIPVDQETASLKLFLASTIQNAPQYLVFTLRMAIGLVLVLGLLWAVRESIEYEK